MINLGDRVDVRFLSGETMTGLEVVGTDYLGTWITVDLGSRHDQVRISWVVGENRGVKCGNHSSVAHHCSIDEVRACYAAHFSERRVRQAGPVRGWWDLPIAESMWRADAAILER